MSAAKHGREDVDYLHPLIQPILEETYGVIIYQEQVMQIARALSGFSLGEADHSAQRDGQEDQEGDGRSSAPASSRAQSAMASSAAAPSSFRAGGEIRRLWLQQIARRSLRADRLSDRLPQGELPDRVHRRIDDARFRQHRQAECLRSGSPQHGYQGAAAFGQSFRGDIRPERRRHPLFLGGLEEYRQACGRAYLRRAAEPRLVPRPLLLRARRQSAHGQ